MIYIPLQAVWGGAGIVELSAEGGYDASRSAARKSFVSFPDLNDGWERATVFRSSSTSLSDSGDSPSISTLPLKSTARTSSLLMTHADARRNTWLFQFRGQNVCRVY